MQAKSNGFTLRELLIVLAIIGVLATVGITSGAGIARRQAAQGAIATFQQSVWQGATLAASRGQTIELRRSGDELHLVGTRTGNTLRTYELPAGVDIPVSNPILSFLPPGKVDTTSLNNLPDELVINTGEGRYELTISLIGEVFATRLGDS